MITKHCKQRKQMGNSKKQFSFGDENVIISTRLQLHGVTYFMPTSLEVKHPKERKKDPDFLDFSNSSMKLKTKATR